MSGVRTDRVLQPPGSAAPGESTGIRVLVLGVGNVLVGDEGVGVHAVRALQAHRWPGDVAVVDGGTGGFHLLGLLQSAPRVILIDATFDGRPPGTVSRFPARAPTDFPAALGAHEIGLRDLLSAAAFVGELPEIEVVTISVDELKPMSTQLSPAVASAVPVVERLMLELLGEPMRDGVPAARLASAAIGRPVDVLSSPPATQAPSG